MTTQENLVPNQIQNLRPMDPESYSFFWSMSLPQLFEAYMLHIYHSMIQRKKQKILTKDKQKTITLLLDLWFLCSGLLLVCKSS